MSVPAAMNQIDARVTSCNVASWLHVILQKERELYFYQMVSMYLLSYDH